LPIDLLIIKKIRLILIIIAGILICVLAGMKVYQYHLVQNKQNLQKESLLLLQEENEFANALQKNDVNLIYNMFNSTFIRETDIQTFTSILENWLNGRSVKKLKVQNQLIYGRGGHITSWVSFNNGEKEFLYQQWINTTNGWRLLWLTKLLPSEFSYGVSDKKEIKNLQQQVLNQLIVEEGISLLIGDASIPETVIIVLDRNEKKSNLKLPDRTVREVPRDEIKKNMLALFYIKFATIRILEDIATSYVNIICPLYENGSVYNRTRGIQLFFIKENGKWKFDSYGTRIGLVYKKIRTAN
jgi:hypothetical protein